MVIGAPGVLPRAFSTAARRLESGMITALPCGGVVICPFSTAVFNVFPVVAVGAISMQNNKTGTLIILKGLPK